MACQRRRVEEEEPGVVIQGRLVQRRVEARGDRVPGGGAMSGEDGNGFLPFVFIMGMVAGFAVAKLLEVMLR